MTAWMESLAQDGYVLLPGVFPSEAIEQARRQWSELQSRHISDEAILTNEAGSAYGARNLLRLWPEVIELARQPALRDALCRVLGRRAGVVRALFFDKPPGHTWALPWHKDYNIAVIEHVPEGVFTKPTTKAGVPHVLAPESVLNGMVTARIHLDRVTAENGPLRVIAGSHRFYSCGEDEPRDPVAIHCRAGDVLLMRPLLTHASGNCRPGVAVHRRIVHLECAASPVLPHGYRWHRYEPLIEC